MTYPLDVMLLYLIGINYVLLLLLLLLFLGASLEGSGAMTNELYILIIVC